MYKCKECGLAVVLLPNGEKIWACDHKGTIITDMESTLVGVGGIKL